MPEIFKKAFVGHAAMYSTGRARSGSKAGSH